VTLGPVAPAVLDAVRRGASQRHKVAIDYYSFGRDGRSTRTVQPWRVFNRSGQWYLNGWCELAGGERLFRVDRIRSAEILDDTFPAPPPGPAPSRRGPTDRANNARPGARPAVYQPHSSDPLVVLDLAPAAHWVAEEYPNEGVERRPDGRLRVRLRANQRPWLERLLLRVGLDATMVEGDAQVRADAATRILRRYQR
jgi:proteasome accessory factor C